MIGQMMPSRLTPADIDIVATRIAARGADSSDRRQIDHLKALFNFCIFDAPALAARYNLRSNPAESLGRHRRGLRARFAKAKPRNRVSKIGSCTMVAGARCFRDAPPHQADFEAPPIDWAAARRSAAGPAAPIDARSQATPLAAEDDQEGQTSGRASITPGGRLFEQASKPSHGDWLFPDPTQPAHCISNVALPSAQRHLFEARLPDLVPATAHDLRRTAATGMRRIGIPHAIVRMVLNHSEQGDTARHYDHWEGFPEKRDALCQWSDHVLQLLG